jgi:hypothetical protein
MLNTRLRAATFLITILLISQLSFAQVDYTVDIQTLEQLPEAKSVRHHKQTNQISRYRIIGATDKSIVVQETVKVYAKSSYVYDFDNEVLLHYYDKTGSHELKFTKSIWKQTRQNQAGDAVQSTVKLNNEDLVPKLYVLNNVVYAISANYYKRYSDNPKLKAAPVSIIRETANGVTVKDKLLYADVANYARCNLSISIDSAFFYTSSKTYLTKADKKSYKTAIHTYDENLEVKDYIPLKSLGRTYISSSKLVLLETDIRASFKGNSSAPRGIITVRVIDMDDQSEESDVISIGSFIRNYGGYIDHYQLLDFGESSATILLGNTCVTCSRTAKKIKLATIDINFDGDSDLASFNETDVEAIKEDEDSDQSDFQKAFYDALAEVDVTEKDIGAQSLIDVQYNPGVTTSSVKYVRSVYMVSTPILLHNQTEDGIKSLALNRAMNNYGYNKHLPLVIGKGEDFILLLSNFSVPEVSKDDIKMYATGSQVLEFSIVDLTTNTVYRENINGELELTAKNDLFYISPGEPLILGKQLFCLSRTSDNELYLAKMTW